MLKNQVAVGDGLPASLIVLAPSDVVNALAVHFAATIDLHSIFELAIGLHDHWTQLPLACDFDFLQNVDLVSCLVSSQMQDSGDCPSSKNFAQKTRHGVLWTPWWTPNPKIRDTKVDTKPLSY
jgi:hypothetical protein